MRRTLRILGLIVGLAVMAALAFEGYKLYQMGPRDYFGMMRYDQREEGELAVGAPAPDVTLLGLDGRSVRLRDRIGAKPVVLVFGSYT
ncbi:MAG TPA: hypothetical protein VN493_18180 [Thermoanaerobaculia bacterium]|nr:hypothetical protein [Thermoanaerobaculia bacterium]